MKTGITILIGVFNNTRLYVEYDKKHVTIIYDKESFKPNLIPSESRRANWDFFKELPEQHKELFIYED